MTDSITELARDRLGFAALRPGQGEAIDSLLAGSDTLLVMPTGSGKSAVYQLAGLVIDGPTIVVSPLLALQHDQVQSIAGHELRGGAAQLNSTLTDGERAEILAQLQDGGLEFCFLAPEQLARDDTVDALRVARPSLLVVDEAHCISSWGHDFRSDYLRLGSVVDGLDHPTVLALTATASPPVRDEIVSALHMHEPEILVCGFERPELHLAVRRCADERGAAEELEAAVSGIDGTGLVYVDTRARADELAAALTTEARPALAYHGGLDDDVRAEVHERFADPAPSLVCATVAFGLGIDVPHVRFVVHDTAPESVDAYYQEVGRAGRDGAPAWGILIDRIAQDGVRTHFAGSTSIDGGVLHRLLTTVRDADGPVALADVADDEDITETRLLVAVSRLAELGAVELDAVGTIARGPADEPVPELVEAAVERQDRFGDAERDRAEVMRRYADERRCRWRQLLEYFGQPVDGPCGHCDVCDAGESAESVDGPWQAGDAVEHTEFGAGRVVSGDDVSVTVRFDDGTHRQLAIELLEAGSLLRGTA